MPIIIVETFSGTHRIKTMKPSPREAEFLMHVCTDLTYKEIADKMKVSVRTVDGYRESLFRKLNVRSRTGLVIWQINSSTKS